MIRTRFLLLGLLLAYTSTLLGQTWSADTLYLQAMNMPIPAVDTLVAPVYLFANPLRPDNTSGNKLRIGDWVNIDNHDKVHPYMKFESLFVYIHNPRKIQEYDFLYKGLGEPLSEEAFKGITFTKFPAFLKILEPYRIPMPPRKGRNLFEVYRWQHPNLHVVVYDKERGGYYRYRIVLTIYEDPNHPEAFVIFE